jgi:hypothetical protein
MFEPELYLLLFSLPDGQGCFDGFKIFRFDDPGKQVLVFSKIFRGRTSDPLAGW